MSVLDGHEVTRVLSSPALRCVQTVEPFAAARGLEVEPDERLAEGADHAGTELARTLLAEPVLICSHGDVIPAIVRAAVRDGVDLAGEPPCGLASVWIVSGCDRRFDTARYVGVG